MDIPHLFFERYDNLRRLMTRLPGEAEATWRARPHGVNSIAWLVWHMARVEDCGLNRLVFDHAGSWVFGKKHTFDFFAYIIFGAVLAAVIPEVVLPVVFFGYLIYKPSLLLFRFVFPGRKARPARSSEGRDHGE